MTSAQIAVQANQIKKLQEAILHMDKRLKALEYKEKKTSRRLKSTIFSQVEKIAIPR